MTLALFSVGRTCRVSCAKAERFLPSLADASVDAVVTDPPAGISFMGRAWDGDKGGRDKWIAWLAEILEECRRILKPGGHALVWALPRTSHWTATAIEDAGFEVRDRIAHLFGSGFPKSHNVSKAIDAHLGVERPVVAVGGSDGVVRKPRLMNPGGGETESMQSITAPGSPEAARWDGWGTALKPACEDWWLGRKPLAGTVAENVLEHGTGALNIDGTRIGTDIVGGGGGAFGRSWSGGSGLVKTYEARPVVGRWPANVTLDEAAADQLDEQSGVSRSNGGGTRRTALGRMNDDGWTPTEQPIEHYNDLGGASRFFYVAKPAATEKDAGGAVDNEHPTVKPIALMRYLVRLITPPGGTVLDPFLGSGTTGVACAEEGFSFVGCDDDPASFATALGRLERAYGSIEDRSRFLGPPARRRRKRA